MDGSSKLAGWEIYPQNLNYVRGCDIHGYNFTSFCQQLSTESKLHFVRGKDVIAVKVVEFGAQGKPCAHSYVSVLFRLHGTDLNSYRYCFSESFKSGELLGGKAGTRGKRRRDPS